MCLTCGYFRSCKWHGSEETSLHAIAQAQSESQDDVASTVLGERVAARMSAGVVTKIPHNFTTSSKGELESALASDMIRGGGEWEMLSGACHTSEG
jgi:hypothetical protein